MLADGETNPEYLTQPFLCEAAPNPFNFFLSFFVSFATAVATTGETHAVDGNACIKQVGVGTPRNALPLLCGSFLFLVLKYGLAHLHTELV
ncbi:hypothetical protein [Nostoc sp.]